MSWSGLASAFAPLLTVLCLGWRPTESLSIVAIFLGLGVALMWRLLGWQDAVYEGMPGIGAGLILLIFFVPASQTRGSARSRWAHYQQAIDVTRGMGIPIFTQPSGIRLGRI